MAAHPLLRPSLLLVGAALVAAGGCSPDEIQAGRPPERPDPAARPDPLARAVRATVAAGSARFVARVRVDHGPVVVVRGVSSLAGPDARAVATVAGRPEGPAAEVRVVGGRAWLRVDGAGPWVPVEHPEPASRAASWSSLLADLARSPATTADRSGRRLTTRVDGDRVAVALDGEGRITRIERRRPGLEVTVRLSDFGAEVVVAPP